MNNNQEMLSEIFAQLAEKMEQACGDWKSIPVTVKDLERNIRLFAKIKDIERKKGNNSMLVLVMQIKLYAPWVQSLKEKRMIVKSINGKLSNSFHVSVAEVGAQDIHKTIVIGIASLVENLQIADQLEEKIINCIETNYDAEIINYDTEIR